MKICIIGIGRLGRQLARAIHKTDLSIAALYNRTSDRAERLAGSLNCKFAANIEDLPSDADLYLLSVKDDALHSVAKQLRDSLGPKVPAAHTSGVHSMDVLAPYFDRYGGCYPLNSFSDVFQVDWSNTPIFIQSPSSALKNSLRLFAGQLSSIVYPLKDHQRLPLHVAAVWVNNFTNHLLHISKNIAEDHDIPFEYLLPLLQTTIEKALEQKPEDMQTGPARRGDRQTLKRHTSFLQKNHPRYETLYRQLSEHILNTYGEQE